MTKAFNRLIIAALLTITCCTVQADTVYRDYFSSDPFENNRWHVGQGVVWDPLVGNTLTGSIFVPSGVGDSRISQADMISVNAGDFLEAECWVKTIDSGDVYFLLQWLKDEQVLSEAYGGTFKGRIVWRPNKISGTNDWTKLRARGATPKGADRARIVLIRDGNKGDAWFDDVMIRIVPPHEIAGEIDKNPAITDYSTLTPADYVTVKDGHLWYKDKRLRVWSAQGNLAASTHKDIDLEVARYKEHGFNGYRSLWWHLEIDDEYTPGDLSDWDRRDYLIASLGRNGIFFWSDILNSCQVRPDLVNAIDDPSTANEWTEAVRASVGSAGYINIKSFLPLAWDPRSQKIYSNYMKRLLEHRNPYNGLTYAEDPTIFTWELTNEEWWIMRMLWGNHLSLPEFFQKQLYRMWNDWLIGKYGDDAGLQSAWGQLVDGESLDRKSVLLLPLLGDTDASAMAKAVGLGVEYAKLNYKPEDFSKTRSADVVEFLMTLHINYKKESARVFKSLGRKGLGSQIVPLLYDTGYSGAVLPLYMHSFADATATGVYGDMRAYDPNHPTFPFASGLTSPPKLHGWIDNRRVLGKPAYIYENMTFNPQKYRVEWIYRILALTTIQDFDVVDFHYYGHPLSYISDPDPFTAFPLQYISKHREWDGTIMRQDEVLMSAVKVAGEIFKGGYLGYAPSPTVVTLGSDTLWNISGIYGGKYAKDADATVFRNGFRWAFNPDQKEDTVLGPLIDEAAKEAETVVKPTEDITYNWNDGVMVIDNPRAKVLIGFVPESFGFNDGLSLENIRINTPEGMPFAIEGERYIGFGISSTDGKPLANSSHIVISAVNTSFNTGFTMDLELMAQDKAYAYGLARSITNKGDVPVLVGRVGLTLKAKWLEGRSYRMIDYNGSIIAEGVCNSDKMEIPDSLPVYLTELHKR